MSENDHPSQTLMPGIAGTHERTLAAADEAARPTATFAVGHRVRRRSLLAQAIVDAFGQVGARVGLCWILCIAVMAVFAPVVASTAPFAVKSNGVWSFPMVRALTWMDWTILAFAVSLGVTFLTRKLGGVRRLIICGSATLVVAALAFFLASPPRNTIYQNFRRLERNPQTTVYLRTLVPFSPNDRLFDFNGDDVSMKPPTAQHWLGTTTNKEDVLSRMIHACRVTLSIGFIATGISLLIGIAIGGLMGYFAGIFDLLAMRVIEIIESIPTIVVLMIVMVAIGRNLYLMMIVIGLLSWTGNARFIRAEFLRLRKQDFVQAGIATGLSTPTILFKHMLPNGVSPVLVQASFGVAGAILLEATLSFLGLGLGPDDSSWGQLLSQATGAGGFNWWIAIFPGGAIFLTVFAYVLIGEAMRDALDPRLKKREA